MSSILYKYRKLEPWEHLLDVFINERLYASEFKKLNDPMEGMFAYSENQVSKGFIKELVDEKGKQRICSLSSKSDNMVMWSYYADGHKGVVLGVEVIESNRNTIDVTEVTYRQRISFRGYYGSDPEIDARNILSKKLNAWKHEGEVRVFSKSKIVPIRLRQVFLGCSMPAAHRRLVKQLLGKTHPEVELIQMRREDLDSHNF